MYTYDPCTQSKNHFMCYTKASFPYIGTILQICLTIYEKTLQNLQFYTSLSRFLFTRNLKDRVLRDVLNSCRKKQWR